MRLLLTPEGHVLVAGQSDSFGPGNYSSWLAEHDATGEQLWARSAGSSQQDNVYDAAFAADDAVVLVGATGFFDAAAHVGFDRRGRLPWSARIDSGPLGSQRTALRGALPLAGGNVIAAGFTRENTNISQLVLREIDAAGGLVRSSLFSRTGSVSLGVLGLAPAADGDGWLVVGQSERPFGGSQDALLVRVSGDHEVLWSQLVGGPEGDSAVAAVIRPEGGWVVAGWTGFVSGGDRNDPWLFAIDEFGTVDWELVLASADPEQWDEFDDVAATPDGGFVACGVYDDIWDPRALLVKVSASGELQWQRLLGAASTRVATTLTVLPDGDLLVGGVIDVNGDFDAWLARLGPDGEGCADCETSAPSDLVAETQSLRTTSISVTVEEDAPAVADLGWVSGPGATRAELICWEGPSSPPPEVSPPGSSQPLLFLDKETITWQLLPCGTSHYDLLRGYVAELWDGSLASCLQTGLPDNIGRDPQLPGVGRAFAYLVTAGNDAGDGPAGRSSSLLPRVVEPCP